MTLEDIIETIKLLTVKVETDKEKGTGVLVIQNNKAYILTVYHCIYGKEEPYHIVDKKNVTFKFNSKITQKEIKPLNIKGYKANIVLLEVDINKLRVNDIKNLLLLDRAFYGKSYYLRGYPKILTHDKPFKAECDDINLDEVTFSIIVDGLTKDTSGENIIDLVKRLSGSGVFFSENNQLYLVGLVNSLPSDGGIFDMAYCKKLVDLNNSDIKLSQYQEKPSSKLTKEILKEQREKSPFKPIKKNTNQIYIERNIDKTILDTINNKHSSVLFINGQGGVGKSTLLEKFSKTDNPTIFIHLKDRVDMSILDIFLDEDKTTIYNCPKFQDKLDDILIAKENDEKIPITMELELLEALQEDFKEHGVFIVDTFEKIKNFNIQSNVSFKNNNTPITTQSISYRFRDYLEYLVYIFLSSTTFIIAGRNCISDIKEDKSKDKYLNLKEVRELSLDNFSLPQVEEYIKGYNLEKPSDNQLSIMDELTHGNPLLIYLFIKIVNYEYKGNWDELDYFEMKEIVQEDSKYGLIYYFTERILSHIDIKDIWKLVIPRVLIREIEEILFNNKKTFDLLVDVGLAQNGKGKQRNIYTLHDNIYDAILSHAKSELSNYKLSSWYDNKKVRKLNKIMIDFFKHCNNLKNINCQFEECYHKIMRIKNFEKTYIIKKSNNILFNNKIDRDNFARSFLGSLLFSKGYKIDFCKKFKKLENKEVKRYILIAINEQFSFKLTSNLYNEISTAISFEKIDNIYDLKFLEKLSQNKLKDDWSVYFWIGLAYSQNKEYKNAIDAYSKSLQKKPKYIDEIYFGLGYVYDEIEEYENAVKAYKKAIEISPNRDDIYYTLGITYMKQEDYTNAIKVNKKAVELNPSHYEAYYQLGTIYLYYKKEYNNAINAYYKIVDINPDNFPMDNVYYKIGGAYYHKEEYAKALENYLKVIELNPSEYRLYYPIGELYFREENYDKAIEYCKKSIERNLEIENSYLIIEHSYHEIGILYYDKKEYDNAIEAYQKAIDINPEYDDAYYNMGVAYRDRNKKEYLKEIELYQKAIDINPNYEYAYHNMGVAYFHLKEIDKTIEIYEKVLQINPNNRQVERKLLGLKQNYEYYKSLD